MQERQGTVEVRVVPDEEPIELEGATVTPIRLAEDYPETLELVRAFGARRTVLSHDDLVRLGERDG